MFQEGVKDKNTTKKKSGLTYPLLNILDVHNQSNISIDKRPTRLPTGKKN